VSLNDTRIAGFSYGDTMTISPIKTSEARTGMFNPKCASTQRLHNAVPVTSSEMAKTFIKHQRRLHNAVPVTSSEDDEHEDDA
jgi:hypothetical protein